MATSVAIFFHRTWCTVRLSVNHNLAKGVNAVRVERPLDSPFHLPLHRAAALCDPGDQVDVGAIDAAAFLGEVVEEFVSWHLALKDRGRGCLVLRG